MAPIYAQIIGCGLAACLAGVGYLAARYDIFRKAKWEICPMEGFTYVYVEHLGPYKTVGKSFNKLKAELEAVGMNLSWDKDRFVGVYLDDPRQVPASECRGRVGVIVDDEAAATCPLPSMTYKTQDTAQSQMPYFDYVSVMVAISKAYAAFIKFCEARGDDVNESYGEMIELYDMPNRVVTFHAIQANE